MLASTSLPLFSSTGSLMFFLPRFYGLWKARVEIALSIFFLLCFRLLLKQRWRIRQQSIGVCIVFFCFAEFSTQLHRVWRPSGFSFFDSSTRCTKKTSPTSSNKSLTTTSLRDYNITFVRWLINQFLLTKSNVDEKGNLIFCNFANLFAS